MQGAPRRSLRAKLCVRAKSKLIEPLPSQIRCAPLLFIQAPRSMTRARKALRERVANGERP